MSKNSRNQKIENLMKPHRGWCDIVGNRTAVDTLKAMLTARRTQPLLITGEYGTGKTALAELFAKYVLELIGVTGFTLGSYLHTHNCADGNDPRDRDKRIRNLFKSDWGIAGTRVILFDEADIMSKAAQRFAATNINTASRDQLYIFMAKALPSDVGMRQRLTHIKLHRLDRAERLELIQRAWRDDRVAHILGGLSEARLADFIAAINRAELDVPRNIYNALDAFVLGMGADESVESNMLR